MAFDQRRRARRRAAGGLLEVESPGRGAETVATVVRPEHADFDGRPVRDVIPLFVERRARRELATSRS
ncbi:three-helix bundle dimerization domain-containing protein [Mycolicibacterium hodleri]|uniref:three-helix bundle dimerization domain-containing protein n=1 Tax=Mycolicibacterium hodleri TaxID=49897 RepID=UPI0035589C43